MKRKIYVASSWRNELQPMAVESLREAGHEVYDFRNPPGKNTGFAWSDIDLAWRSWTTEQYEEALTHPLAIAGFNSDFDGMKWADTCVMLLPCGRSANTEAGWMKGAGKEVYVFSPVECEPELMYKMHDGIYDTMTSLIERLNKMPIKIPKRLFQVLDDMNVIDIQNKTEMVVLCPSVTEMKHVKKGTLVTIGVAEGVININDQMSDNPSKRITLMIVDAEEYEKRITT